MPPLTHTHSNTHAGTCTHAHKHNHTHTHREGSSVATMGGLVMNGNHATTQCFWVSIIGQKKESEHDNAQTEGRRCMSRLNWSPSKTLLMKIEKISTSNDTPDGKRKPIICRKWMQLINFPTSNTIPETRFKKKRTLTWKSNKKSKMQAATCNNMMEKR